MACLQRTYHRGLAPMAEAQRLSAVAKTATAVPRTTLLIITLPSVECLPSHYDAVQKPTNRCMSRPGQLWGRASPSTAARQMHSVLPSMIG